MKKTLEFDLRALEAFVLTCRKGSMAAAAAHLGISQPAVSQIIKSLEAAFSVELIDRRYRPLSLTASGIFLRDKAEHILLEAHRIPLALNDLKRGFPPNLRIGVVESLSAPFLPDLLSHLQPSLQSISVASGLASALRNALIDFHYDIIFTNDPLNDVDSLVRHEIFAEPYILLVPKSVIDAEVSLDFDTLSKTLPLIRWSAQSRTGLEIERHLRRIGFRSPRAFEFDAADSLAGMVAAGLGWAIMPPLSLANSLSKIADAQAVPLPGKQFSRRINIISRADSLEKVSARLAVLSRKILKERYLPTILKFAPWLEGEISFEPQHPKENERT